jgi:hypothetical protein
MVMSAVGSGTENECAGEGQLKLPYLPAYQPTSEKESAYIICFYKTCSVCFIELLSAVRFPSARGKRRQFETGVRIFALNLV